MADTLRALKHDAQALDAQRNALDASQASRELSQASHQFGQARFLQVLDAQRLFDQARPGYAKARGQRCLDSAQLFVAMGGGWRASGDSERIPRTSDQRTAAIGIGPAVTRRACAKAHVFVASRK
ncbi:hypothetical protein [Paraburkholderia phenazinium]|uniref:hypothetical protein n=1 Tax=Paraburkholderia phenazinium TaxID=60549 RepID=UPI003CC5430B